VLVLSAEALCELQRGAESQGERFATELLSAAGFSMGQGIARQLQHPERDAMALATAYLHALSSLGMGLARIVRLDLKERVLEVDVQGSPFVATYARAEGPSCPFWRGLVTGLAEVLFGVGVAGEEVACVALGAERCRFRSRGTSVAEEETWSW
jgi:predicted hydrocarbon binding protein